MITDKQVIERLRQYEAVFTPAFRYITVELNSPKPSLDKIDGFLDANDAQMALLDFCDLLAQVQGAKKKLTGADQPPLTNSKKGDI